jgi:arsenite-transporting ATPase
MRIIVYTGKGGVGKTSVSAATALRCAESGLRTIVISTDTAHSLADSLQTELGPEPQKVTENLWAQEIDVRYSIERYWGAFQRFLVSLFMRGGAESVIVEEVTIIPGLEEGASLLWLNEFRVSGDYDVLVMDAAPTAETLRLLSMPEALRWWVERLLPLGRVTSTLLRPLARPFVGDLPDREAFNDVEELFDNLDQARSLLADTTRSSIRLVVNAERMVIKETQRTYTYLNLYGYPVDAVVCNRLLPDEVSDPYFKAWKDTQATNLDLIHECFDPLPLLTAPLFSSEVGGLDALRELAAQLYGDLDPTTRLFEDETQSLNQDDDGSYWLRLPLPFAQKEKIDLYHSSDELTLRVGAYRRNITLPHSLRGLDVGEARFNDATLSIHFVPAT